MSTSAERALPGVLGGGRLTADCVRWGPVCERGILVCRRDCRGQLCMSVTTGDAVDRDGMTVFEELLEGVRPISGRCWLGGELQATVGVDAVVHGTP